MAYVIVQLLTCSGKGCSLNLNSMKLAILKYNIPYILYVCMYESVIVQVLSSNFEKEQLWLFKNRIPIKCVIDLLLYIAGIR